MAGKKREYSDLSSCDPCDDAHLHGIVTSLSPMKKSKSNCSYFEGVIADSKGSMRVFGFDSTVHRRLAEVKEESIEISQCEIKKSRRGESLEVLMKKNMEISKSPVKIHIPRTARQEELVHKIEDLGKMTCFQQVNVIAKALKVDDPEEVGNGKKKQDVLVGDASGMIRVALWEEEIGMMEEGQSYELNAVVVREYRGKRFLSTSRNKSKIEAVDGVAEVEEEESEENCSICIEFRQLSKLFKV